MMIPMNMNMMNPMNLNMMNPMNMSMNLMNMNMINPMNMMSPMNSQVIDLYPEVKKQYESLKRLYGEEGLFMTGSGSTIIKISRKDENTHNQQK